MQGRINGLSLTLDMSWAAGILIPLGVKRCDQCGKIGARYKRSMGNQSMAFCDATCADTMWSRLDKTQKHLIINDSFRVR